MRHRGDRSFSYRSFLHSAHPKKKNKIISKYTLHVWTSARSLCDNMFDLHFVSSLSITSSTLATSAFIPWSCFSLSRLITLNPYIFAQRGINPIKKLTRTIILHTHSDESRKKKKKSQITNERSINFKNYLIVYTAINKTFYRNLKKEGKTKKVRGICWLRFQKWILLNCKCY